MKPGNAPAWHLPASFHGVWIAVSMTVTPEPKPKKLKPVWREVGGVRLRVLGNPPEGWEPTGIVPATRGQCPKERPCVHVLCRHHLATVSPIDRPGRRHGNGATPTTLLDLRRLHRGSCALDFALNGEMTSGAISRVLGLTRRRVEQIVALAAGKVELAVKESAALTELIEVPEPSNVSHRAPEVRGTEVKSLPPPRPVASVTLTVDCGSRRVEVTASGGNAAAVLGALRASGSSLARAVYLELRTAMAESEGR